MSPFYQTWFTWLYRNWCLCMWVVWPRDHEVRIIWYQSLAPIIRLYIFISCILFFTFRVNFSLCFCFGSDLVENQFQSDCLLPMLFLISCVELSLLGLKKRGVILFFLSRISFYSKKNNQKSLFRTKGFVWLLFCVHLSNHIVIMSKLIF
jgi:hypothetical protein